MVLSNNLKQENIMSNKNRQKQSRKAASASANAAQKIDLAAYELSEQELAAVVGGRPGPLELPPLDALKLMSRQSTGF